MSNSSEGRSDFWRVYFFFLLLPGILGYLWINPLRAYDVIDSVSYAVAVVGAYLYIWNKSFLPKTFWKINFFLHIGWTIFYSYLIPLPETIFGTFGMSQALLSSINLIGYIPLFIALYLYAFDKKSVWPKT